MTEFKQGDRVRVTFEAEYVRPSINHEVEGHVLNTYEDGCHITVPFTADIELIERADDPSKDPVGTVRKGSGSIAIRTDVEARTTMPWLILGNPSDWFRNEQVTGWKVIGAVPGTPAAAKLTADDPKRELY